MGGDRESTGVEVAPDADGTGSDPAGSDPALEVLGDAEAGGVLYHAVTHGCYVCHGDFAQGTALAPGVGAATATEVHGALMAGTQHSGGPQLDFTAQDLADLAAFLEDPDPKPPDMSTNGPDADTSGLS